MKVVANAGSFIFLYLLFMLPTYFLPFLGSNSALVGSLGVATGVGINPAFWAHLGCFLLLVMIAWARGARIHQQWLVVFPAPAGIFDLFPGINSIPLIPTILHIVVMVVGVVLSKNQTNDPQHQSLEISKPTNEQIPQPHIITPPPQDISPTISPPSVEYISQQINTPQNEKGSLVRLLGNGLVFFVLYILCMLPSYFLPFFGSNSALLGGLTLASGAGINPATIIHAGSLVLLIVITWIRGNYLDRGWLIIFPVLASVFDLIPGINNIPLIPTLMHILAIIVGIIPAQRKYIRAGAPAGPPETVEAAENRVAVDDTKCIPIQPPTVQTTPGQVEKPAIDILQGGNDVMANDHKRHYFIPLATGLAAVGALIIGIYYYFDPNSKGSSLPTGLVSNSTSSTHAVTTVATDNQLANNEESQAKVIAIDSIKSLITICDGNAFIKEDNSVWELKGNIEVYGCHEPPLVSIMNSRQNSWSCGMEIAAPNMRLYNPGQGWSNWNEGIPFLIEVSQHDTKWVVNTRNFVKVNCEDIAVLNRMNSSKTLVGRVNTPGDGFLALRSEPGIKGGYRILKIPHGTQLTIGDCVTDTDNGKWCKTEYGGQNGWVLDRYLTLTPTNKSVTQDSKTKASFNCDLAKKPAEITICQTNVLSGFDKEMAEIYTMHLAIAI